jgi:hypothetical protein
MVKLRFGPMTREHSNTQLILTQSFVHYDMQLIFSQLQYTKRDIYDMRKPKLHAFRQNPKDMNQN